MEFESKKMNQGRQAYKTGKNLCVKNWSKFKTIIRTFFSSTPNREKGKHELAYWAGRKKAEGILGNRHYRHFFTTHFGLDQSFYSMKSILDIGSGPRGSLEWAKEASIRVGLDPLVYQYRKLGTGRHQMQYEAAESEHIPHKDGIFDVVSAFNSLDHVNNLMETIAEIKRVLKPGGFFLLLTDVNHEPTKCEPISFSWDVVEQFLDRFMLVDFKHYEKSKSGIYDSIQAGFFYDHSNPTKRYGILSAKFVKIPNLDYP